MSIWSDQAVKELLERVKKLEEDVARLQAEREVPRATLSLKDKAAQPRPRS